MGGIAVHSRGVNLTDAELFQEAARRSAAREPFVLCTVTATARSAPRDAGAKMLVSADGAISGSVGGGPLEAVVIQEAVRLLQEGSDSCERRYALTTAGDAAEPIPPGKYAGMVTGKDVPAKYHLVNTAGLMLELAAGANSTDLVLK